MKLRAKRLLAVVLAALAALTLAVTPASATPASAVSGAPVVRAVRHFVEPDADAPESRADLIYRGSYASYFDCDASGAYGVYNGWWTAYVCQSEGGSGIWDLFAG